MRDLCDRAPVRRYDARGGGGFWPDANELWLAAGVETYEGLAQVVLSARHELFHYVNWNAPVYRADQDRGWPAMRASLDRARRDVRGYRRYALWLERSFIPQADHANPVEYFADIPTNFPDPAEIPEPLRAYFGALLREGASQPSVPRRTLEPLELAEFHALLLP
ncbi:MAG TPA: hypothetical protein VFM93_01200 [Candidatus Limnocylindria bacterium]|nr:hypothetical protein [Candidatus Limnocylindria bacterium]